MNQLLNNRLASIFDWVRNSFVLTDGEQKLVTAYAVVIAFGAGISFVVVSQMSHGSLFTSGMSAYQKWVVFCGAVGAGAALRLAGERMGQSGPNGFARAMGGTLWISAVGSLITGTLALPFYGTMFGPFTFVMLLVGSPMLALLWFSNLLAAHLLMRGWRAEQDRLFARLA